MKAVQLHWSDNDSWNLSSLNMLEGKPHLILAFWSAPGSPCELHNQTMTITTLVELG